MKTMKTEADYIDAVVKHNVALQFVPREHHDKQWYIAAAVNANMRIHSIKPGDTPADKEWSIVMIDTIDLVTGEASEHSWVGFWTAGSSLTVLPPELRTEEMCKMAMGASTAAWDHIPEEIKKQIFAAVA